MTIIPHFFNKNQIDQLSEDTFINGVLLQKGYVNATQICKASGKRWNNYSRNKTTEAFLLALEAVTRIRVTALVQEFQGTKDKTCQDTWVHPYVAMNLSQWVSAEFAAWAAITLNAVINNDFQALTEEAEQAKLELQKNWNKIREEGKIARRTLTNAIQDYKDRHPELSDGDRQWMYANVSDLLNLALFGMKAKKLCELRQCDRSTLRDTHIPEHLKWLEYRENHAMKLIDKLDTHPIEAIREAIEFYL